MFWFDHLYRSHEKRKKNTPNTHTRSFYLILTCARAGFAHANQLVWFACFTWLCSRDLIFAHCANFNLFRFLAQLLSRWTSLTIIFRSTRMLLSAICTFSISLSLTLCHASTPHSFSLYCFHHMWFVYYYERTHTYRQVHKHMIDCCLCVWKCSVVHILLIVKHWLTHRHTVTTKYIIYSGHQSHTAFCLIENPIRAFYIAFTIHWLVYGIA